MSFKCPNCEKVLSSNQRLQAHLSKTMPCDFVCRTCGVKSGSRSKYYYHVKQHTPQANNEQNEDDNHTQSKDPDLSAQGSEIQVACNKAEAQGHHRIRLPGDDTRRIVPIQDFNDLDIIRKLARIANEQDADIRVTIDIHPRKRKLAEDAVVHFQTSDYANSLRCLDQDINEAAANMLSDFHSDPNRPELHAIRLADNARKIVKMYSRPTPEDDRCEWMHYNHQPTLDALSEHAKALLTYSLERAANQLQFKFCAKEQCVCFCLHDTVLNKNLIIVDDNDFSGENEAVMRALKIQPVLKVMFYDGELTDIVQGFGYTEKARQLGILIEQKTEEVLTQIKDLQFTEADVRAFLERTRRPLTMLKSAQ